MMRTLVVGATGIVGGYIVDELIRRGVRPLAMSRSARHSDQVDWIQGDLTIPEDLQTPLVGTVFCTAEIGLLAEALSNLECNSLKRVVAFTSTSLITKIHSEIVAEREGLKRMAEGESGRPRREQAA